MNPIAKASTSRYLAVPLAFLGLQLFLCSRAQGADPLSQAQFILKSPDVSVSRTYDLPAPQAILDGLLQSPMVLARLWEVYGYAPPYKARMRGEAIHVDDPTGIAGDIYLAAHSVNRHVYLGIGALNHRLVPAFQGRMALVLTVTPKGSMVNVRVEVSIRTDSRLLGFFTRTLFPLIRPRIENRMSVHARDIGAILDVLATAPQHALSRLNNEERAALTKIITLRPQAAGSAVGSRRPGK